MFNNAGLAIMSAALDAVITGVRLHSGARGSDGTANRVGSLVSVDVIVTGNNLQMTAEFTGLAPNQPIAEASYYAGSTYVGGSVRGGGSDATANAAGEYTANITEALASA